MAEIILPRHQAAAAKPVLKPIVTAIAASIFVALCAQIVVPLPFTPVPLSMAPFGVLLVGLLVSPRLAFAALTLYLAEGAVGLPVFSPHSPGGIVHLLGPTGGYLLSYPFAAALTALLYRRQGFLRAFLSSGIASLLILAAGAAWLATITHLDARLVFAQAIRPFLVGDVLKVCLAAAAATFVTSIRNRRQPADETL